MNHPGGRTIPHGTRTRAEVERWYGLHGPALAAYAAALLGDRSAADDVVQQVFLRLLAGEVPAPEDPRPYLFGAVRNVAMNFRRGERREAARRQASPMFDAPPESQEARVALEEAIDGLPAEQREIVMLRVWGEMTIEEAAGVAGIPPNTAASRYRYALAKLRERMAPFAGE